MPTFVGLIEYTQQGIDQFEDQPERLEAARDVMAEMGAELQAYYTTLGRYDAIAIADFPDADTALMNSVFQSKQGNVRVETLRAFSQDELEDVIAEMPE